MQWNIARCLKDVLELQRFYRSPAFFEILGGNPSSEIIALLDILLAEKLPPDIAEPFIMRYVFEALVLRNAMASYRTIQ